MTNFELFMLGVKIGVLIEWLVLLVVLLNKSFDADNKVESWPKEKSRRWRETS